MTVPNQTAAKRVLLLGATGTIGRATALALVQAGHKVTCFVRPAFGADPRRGLPQGVTLRVGEVTQPASLRRDGFAGESFDALVSCMASRTGAPQDAWAIDHKAHGDALSAAKEAGVLHMVLLSAICVQKPRLAFQQAKLAFEAELIASRLIYSIVRPTAYFKSLSGQVARVKAGRAFLMFGNGQLTACKPISDGDLGRYLAACLDDASLQNRILPIGGPGDAMTPRQQGEALFALLGQTPRFKKVPVGLLDAIIAVLATLGRVSPKLRAKAELARIGRYYATESMLVLDPSGHYSAEATPSTGRQTLVDHYARLIAGEAATDLGDHAVF